MKNPKERIQRSNATDDEIVRWTKRHDVFDRSEKSVSEGIEDHSDSEQVLHEAIFQDKTGRLNMRLPLAIKAVLTKLARQRTTDATTLARKWLAAAGAGIKSGLKNNHFRLVLNPSKSPDYSALGKP